MGQFAAFTYDVVCNVVFLPTSIVYCFLASFTLKVMLLMHVFSVEIPSLFLDGPIFSYMFLFLIYNSGGFYSILPFRIFLCVVALDKFYYNRQKWTLILKSFISFLFLFKWDNCKLTIPKYKKRKRKRKSDIYNDWSQNAHNMKNDFFHFTCKYIYQSEDFIGSILNKLLRHFKYK